MSPAGLSRRRYRDPSSIPLTALAACRRASPSTTGVELTTMPKSYADLLREARAQIREVTPQEVDALPPGTATIVDVREASEWEQGHIPGAQPRLEELHRAADRGRRARPRRSRSSSTARAASARCSPPRPSPDMGYTDVASMSGGFQAWKSAGFDFETPVVLSAEQKQRYSRHLLIPEVGSAGQAAPPRVEGPAHRRGRPRQPGGAVPGRRRRRHDRPRRLRCRRPSATSSARSSTPPIASASARSSRARIAINALNPDVNVVEHEEMLTAANVERLIDGYDVILDGTDTFETRYVLNDAAVAAGIPVVHASVFRFEGQLTTFVPYEGPCYRCLYPTPPPPELAPGCSVAGVLGVVPGILGLLQTNEALKVLLGIGTTLAGRLLLFDALETEFTELQLRRDPHCPVCSDAAVEARKAGRPLTRSQRRRRRAVPPDHDRSGRHGVAGGARVSTVFIPSVLRAERRRRQVARGRRRLDPRRRRRAGRAAPVARRPAADRRGRPQSIRQRLRQRPGRPLPGRARHAGRRPSDEVRLLPAMAGG